MIEEFLYTVRELLIHPGRSIRDYLTENRKRMVKPIFFIIVTSLIYTLSIHFFNVDDHYIKFTNERKEISSTEKFFRWTQENYGFANIIMGIFIAYWIKLFFLKCKFNFYEILVSLCFIMGMGMLIYSLFAIFEALVKVNLMPIGGIVGIGYCTWALGQFFGQQKVINYFKAFFAYMLGMISFTAIVLASGIFVDTLLKKLF